MAGLKVRIPLGMFDPERLGRLRPADVRDRAAQSTVDLPKVAYPFVRPALGTRVMFAPGVALDVAAGLPHGHRSGLGRPAHVEGGHDFFPNATGAGLRRCRRRWRTGSSGAIGARGRRRAAAVLADHERQHGADRRRGRRFATSRCFAGIEVVLDGQGAAAEASDEEPPTQPASEAQGDESPSRAEP